MKKAWLAMTIIGAAVAFFLGYRKSVAIKEYSTEEHENDLEDIKEMLPGDIDLGDDSLADATDEFIGSDPGS